MDLKDQVVIVFGATSGIGKELLLTLVASRALVLFTGTNNHKGSAVMDQLNTMYNGKRPHRAIFYCSDVTHWNTQEIAFNMAEKHFQRTVDIVVMVAGILDSSSLMNDIEQNESYRTLEVNITAAAKANRLAIQYFLRKKKPGCIINTSSVYGLAAAPTNPLYAASKHAIIGLTKSYGNLLYPTDIRVNVVAPHFVETPLLPGESVKAVSKLGMVSMKNCIDAYIYTMQDTSLNGDVVHVSHLGRTIEPRFLDPVIEQLDTMCSQRKRDHLNAILAHFQ